MRRLYGDLIGLAVFLTPNTKRAHLQNLDLLNTHYLQQYDFRLL